MNALMRLSTLALRPGRAVTPAVTQTCGRQLALYVTAFQGGRRPSNTPYRPPNNNNNRPDRRGRDDRGRRPENMIPMNEGIRAPEVRVIDEAKEPLGIMPTSEALALAIENGLDLILVVPDANPPVCRLVEFSKYNYEIAKAAKDAKKKQRENAVETKELKLRPSTDIHDYQVKVRAAQKFLAKGDKVKLTVQFKGREMEFKEIGREMFNRFLEDLDDLAVVESPMAMQGRQMTMLISPKKEVPQ